MVMRWAIAGFLEVKKAFRRLRGHQHIAALISAMRPVPVELKKAA